MPQIPNWLLIAINGVISGAGSVVGGWLATKHFIERWEKRKQKR